MEPKLTYSYPADLPEDFSDCDPQEEALLRAEVEATTVDCPATAIRQAVVTGRHIYKQDWRQEARKLLRLFGFDVAPSAPAMIAQRGEGSLCQPA